MSLRFVSRSVARAEFVALRESMRKLCNDRVAALKFPVVVEHTALETRITYNNTTYVYTYYRHDLDSSVRITD
jgi:hypothetical protein